MPEVLIAPTGTANLASVQAAFRRLGAEPRVAESPQQDRGRLARHAARRGRVRPRAWRPAARAVAGQWRSCGGQFCTLGAAQADHADRAADQRPGALLISGHSSSGPLGTTSVTLLVSVPKPEPCLGHVIGNDQVDALARGLVRGALERAGLGREADDDRLVGRRWRAAVGRPRPGCRSSARAPASARRRRGRSSCLAAVSRPEIGDGRGHDQRVRVGRAARTAARISAALGASNEVDAARAVALTSCRGSASPAAPRSSAAWAIATPILPVERLPM